MPHALGVNFENIGHLTKNTIFRLVKLLAWSYCQAAGFVAKRKTNQLQKFKKEESASYRSQRVLQLRLSCQVAGGGGVRSPNGEVVGDRICSISDELSIEDSTSTPAI